MQAIARPTPTFRVSTDVERRGRYRSHRQDIQCHLLKSDTRPIHLVRRKHIQIAPGVRIRFIRRHLALVGGNRWSRMEADMSGETLVIHDTIPKCRQGCRKRLSACQSVRKDGYGRKDVGELDVKTQHQGGNFTAAQCFNSLGPG